MEALLSAFLAAALAELGDKTQWLALALAVHFRRTTPILAALALAAIVNAALAAIGGALVAPFMPREASTLMLALALGSAAVSLTFKPKPPAPVTGKGLAFVASFILLMAAELGDKTQFLTFAIAARTAMPGLAAAGAATAVFAMGAAAIFGGRAVMDPAPWLLLRRCAAALFAALSFVAAINAFRLI